MKLRLAIATLVLLVTPSCSNSPSTSINPTVPRSYNGSASVGDFLNITLDPVAHTIAYTNHSN